MRLEIGENITSPNCRLGQPRQPDSRQARVPGHSGRHPACHQKAQETLFDMQLVLRSWHHRAHQRVCSKLALPGGRSVRLEIGENITSPNRRFSLAAFPRGQRQLLIYQKKALDELYPMV